MDDEELVHTGSINYVINIGVCKGSKHMEMADHIGTYTCNIMMKIETVQNTRYLSSEIV